MARPSRTSAGVLTGGTSIPDSFGYGVGGFTGREYVSYLELQYYRARMYDPKLGRFICEDPIGFAGGDPSPPIAAPFEESPNKALTRTLYPWHSTIPGFAARMIFEIVGSTAFPKRAGFERGAEKYPTLFHLSLKSVSFDASFLGLKTGTSTLSRAGLTT